jgi:hypothetical protein
MATATKTAFGKPKAAKGDGTFEFKLPENLGSGRGRIPKGKYIGRCTSIISDTSKSSGNPMWTWEFVITKGPHAGRDFKLWTVLTDDAAWKVAETLSALGIKVTPGEKIKINKKDVIGVGVTMHIKDDAGQDGDGEVSKLDKISAHPSGAGFKSGGGIAAKATEEDDEGEAEEADDMEGDDDLEDPDPVDDDEDLEDEDDDLGDDDLDMDDDDLDDLDDEDDDAEPEEDEEEEPAPRRSAAKKAPAKKAAAKKVAGGKARPALGGTKKKARR